MSAATRKAAQTARDASPVQPDQDKEPQTITAPPQDPGTEPKPAPDAPPATTPDQVAPPQVTPVVPVPAPVTQQAPPPPPTAQSVVIPALDDLLTTELAREDGPDTTVSVFRLSISGASGRGPSAARSYGQVLAALGIRSFYIGSTHDSVARATGQLQFFIVGTAAQQALATAAMQAMNPHLLLAESTARKAENTRQKALPPGHPDKNSYQANRVSRQAMEAYASTVAIDIVAHVATLADDATPVFGTLFTHATDAVLGVTVKCVKLPSPDVYARFIPAPPATPAPDVTTEQVPVPTPA